MWEFKFKRKPKPEFKEPSVYVPQTQEHSPGTPNKLTDYSNHVSQVFNKYCTEMGVQCIIGMDPEDYRRAIFLKVVGDRDVKIAYAQKVYYLAPGEHLKIIITDELMHGGFPEITLLPYGNAAAQQNANPLVDMSKGIEGWQNYKVHQNLSVEPGINRSSFLYPTVIK